MPHPMNDVVIVVPGILGSILHRDGKPVWDVSRGGIVEGLRQRFHNITELRLPAGIADNHPGDGVTAEGLMPDIGLPLGLWTFDLGYTKLLDWLATTFETNTDASFGPRNLLAFPYDWRLSNRYNGAELQRFAETALGEWRDQGGACADARLILICHSMGGLVARWYLDKLGAADVTRALITLGTPHRGSLNAVDQLVNGIRKGVGPFKLNLTIFGRSLPSVHQLLPEYACIDVNGTLHKTTETSLPNVEHTMVTDAMLFHDQLDTARLNTKDGYDMHPIGGYEQPTYTTARINGDHARCLRTFDGEEHSGDGTVPRLSFTPKDLRPSAPGSSYAADNHAGLVHNQAVFDQIEGILTATDIIVRSGGLRLSVDVPEGLDPGEPLVVRARVVNGDVPIEVVTHNHLTGQQLGPAIRLRPGPDGLAAAPDLPGPGVYRVVIRGTGTAGRRVDPITTIVLSWPDEHTLGHLA